MTARALALALYSHRFSSPPPLTPPNAAAISTPSSPRSRARRAAQGVSQNVIAQALGGVTHDPAVMAFDRRQRGTFRKTFEEYAATRVGPARVKRAKAMMGKHAALLAASSSASACRSELIVAIWTMETDNGGDMGKLPVVRTLATLAHDCRRTELFQKELLAALQIVQRGDLPLQRSARRLCGRDRADAVSAVVLHQIRRRFRRQRPCRSAPLRAGRARLHRQPAEGEWLAGRRADDAWARRISR